MKNWTPLVLMRPDRRSRFECIRDELRQLHPGHKFRVKEEHCDINMAPLEVGVEVKVGWLHWEQLDLEAMGYEDVRPRGGASSDSVF